MADIFDGKKVLNKEEKEVDTKNLFGDDKVLGLYFSAHWCPPCRYVLWLVGVSR